MQSMLFVMAILGCGEGDAPCREVALVQAQYRSEASCLAASEGELLRRDDILFPQIVAQCRPANAGPRLIRGSDIMQPAPQLNRAFPIRQASLQPFRSSR